ncbi:hypothetical protein DYB38_010956 [Aphanomyces astaci]|uniref:Aldehyde dehydrogenase domain-containing protein n=1 Tax=Aphanomyces astaci TaxID=112090 RepID=A0A397CRC1_APHAT|nr:hypothetical protein DYB38_010956 [Aphanomyces astaci]
MLSRGLFRAAPLTSALRRNASTAYALPSWAKVNPETLSGASPAEIHNLGTTVFTRSKWVSTKKTEGIKDPLTGEVFLQVPLTQKDELKPFIDNLRSTPKHGLHNPFKNVERYLLYGDISHKAAAMLREPHIEHYFIRLIQRVAPKSYIQAKNEVVVTRKFLENFSGDQVRFLARSFGVPGDHLGQMSTGHRWPYGPVALITPFNFPFEIPILQLLGALYMGNRVTLKLDSKVAVVMYEALRMFHACGMPLTDIFLGMVASGIQPRKGMVGLIEDVTASGIRFVYFSPRNMRRSKLLAEKMGIETDWNCAISLRDSDGPDPHRMTSNYSDWDVKARLPHGTAAIRRHLELVDNVPLLVSLYTDSTPDTIKEMISIFQENGEVVLGVGTSVKESNVPLFGQADLSVALEGNPHTLFDTELPKGSQLPVFSEVDMELSQMLNTLACAFTVRNFTHTRVSPMVVVDLIRLGRHMLTNFIQLVHYIFVMQLYVATVVCLSYVLPFPEVASLGCMSILWLLWIVVPALSLSLLSSPPDRHIMTRTPRKNEASAWTDDATRLCMYFLVRLTLIKDMDGWDGFQQNLIGALR